MKKLCLVVFSLVLLNGTLPAQEELIIQSSDKGFYLDHKVTSKQNFYSIGRLYHTHPRNIASFNGLDMTKGLSLGQTIRIPLTDTNFTQEGNKGVPVYYVTGGDEDLSQISNKNKKVPLSTLRSWNNIQGGNPSAGRKIIIGFLVTNEMQDKMVMLIPEEKKEISTAPAEEKKQEIAEIKKEAP